PPPSVLFYATSLISVPVLRIDHWQCSPHPPLRPRAIVALPLPGCQSYIRGIVLDNSLPELFLRPTCKSESRIRAGAHKRRSRRAASLSLASTHPHLAGRPVRSDSTRCSTNGDSYPPR